MELQRTTAGDSRPASNERHRRRLVCPRPTHFLHRRSLTNTIEKPDCDTSAEKFFHFPFLSPRCVSHFPLVLNALRPSTGTLSTNVKTQRMACYILRARVSSAKTMLHSTLFSQESRQKHLPTFGKKRPSFPTPPPAFRPSPRTALR